MRQCLRARRRKPWDLNDVEQVRGREVGALVPLALEREHGVGADVDATVDAAGEVHAEERVGRVGHGIDQAR